MDLQKHSVSMGHFRRGLRAPARLLGLGPHRPSTTGSGPRAGPGALTKKREQTQLPARLAGQDKPSGMPRHSSPTRGKDQGAPVRPRYLDALAGLHASRMQGSLNGGGWSVVAAPRLLAVLGTVQVPCSCSTAPLPGRPACFSAKEAHMESEKALTQDPRQTRSTRRAARDGVLLLVQKPLTPPVTYS
ncbi:hypothetical protein LLEC1_05656 [Akanthomyces lecanii]|uniref:Uncharacterized protein n=1 Tax=Cordyceps confragosa TaxID=2714763 RepID=A0A179I3U8_CORDF|nr:hypothetical protein LLEC1_05656 [Akanthomyces lecanii]